MPLFPSGRNFKLSNLKFQLILQELCSNKEMENFISFPTMYNNTDLFHMAHEKRFQT